MNDGIELYDSWEARQSHRVQSKPPPRPVGRPFGSRSTGALAFIRKQPLSISTDEVLVRASQAGIEITRHTVHCERSKMRRERRAVQPRKPASLDDRALCMHLILRIGTDEARKLLQHLPARVQEAVLT